jgi:hypothetical protein
MPSYKRTAYLLPARIVVLGGTIAIVVAMVGTATAAAVSSVDTGSQDFRGAQDLGSTVRVDTTPTISALKINAALQPGQTVSAVAPGIGSDPVYGATLWTPALRPTSALQPGQTVSLAVSRVASYDPAHEHLTSRNGSDPVYGATPWTPALGPTSAPQPGQTGW